MPAQIIDGKTLAHDMRETITDEVSQLREEGISPHLTVIIVGDDPASQSYIRGKKKAAQQTNMSFDVIDMQVTVAEQELLDTIHTLNQDEPVHGILVQLPLPDHIDEQKVIQTINPRKDVDGFHPVNIGKMVSGQKAFLPCTPYGIMTMLEAYDISVQGKHAVVIGRSHIVGKPIGQLLLNENATVTYCHSKTHQLTNFTRHADILIAAAGKAHMIDKEAIKEGTVIIDVGMNRLDDGSLTGDVDFSSVSEKASYITPVPKGVGPMTITMLLENTIQAAKGLTGFAE